MQKGKGSQFFKLRRMHKRGGRGRRKEVFTLQRIKKEEKESERERESEREGEEFIRHYRFP